MSCRAAHAASPALPIVVIDASVTDATRLVCEELADQHDLLLYRRAEQPGLTHQRNAAVGICRARGVTLLHFIDDDTQVMPEYFGAITRRFQHDPGLIGVGGVILNQSPVSYFLVKRFFALASRKRGSVLRSGRNMMGQYPGSRATDSVEWLSGCSMSYRLAAFDHVTFDTRLEGYATGEDYVFGFHLSREHRLAVEPEATCIHHLAQTARGSSLERAQERTLTAFALVRENRKFGLSFTAFWWATAGDFGLRAVHGILFRNLESLHEAAGIAKSVLLIARHSHRD